MVSQWTFGSVLDLNAWICAYSVRYDKLWIKGFLHLLWNAVKIHGWKE
jgi:hypothetical protein